MTPTRFETMIPVPVPSQEPTQTAVPPTATPQAGAVTPTGGEPMTPTPIPSEEPTDEGPLLRMIYIRARSSREVQQLRQMPAVDITRVRPDPERPPGEELLSGGYIVEAIVTPGMLAKLKAKGFEVTELPAEK